MKQNNHRRRQFAVPDKNTLRKPIGTFYPELGDSCAVIRFLHTNAPTLIRVALTHALREVEIKTLKMVPRWLL